MGPAVEQDVARPFRVSKRITIRPATDSTRPASRRWLEEEALILPWASAGGFLGDSLGGTLGGIVGFAVAGYYAAREGHALGLAAFFAPSQGMPTRIGCAKTRDIWAGDVPART